MPHPRQACIVGLYVTQQAKSLTDRTSSDLTAEAVLGALDDAGLSPHDVDGGAVHCPWAPGIDNGAALAGFLGAKLALTMNDGLDQAGARGVAKMAAAIEMGLCDVGVVGSARAGAWSQDGAKVGAVMGLEFTDPYGPSTMAHFALVARRYMHQYGVGPEGFATVAATIRNHGAVNPEAVMFGPKRYTVEDVLSARMIASPFTLLDCCLVNEGGCALVMTTWERARELRQTPVLVLGAGMEMLRLNYSAPPRFEEAMALGKDAAARAFGRAGVTVADVDMFSLYDAVSFEVLRQFEMLGLCAPGEGGEFVKGGRLSRDGDCPTNLDGGLLSHSWTGSGQLTLKVIEGVRQLRRTCGDRQVGDAEVALVTNAGSGAHHTEMVVLGRA
ncbi:MAG: thiolase family protein [Caulobacterales bacterium]